MSNLGLNTGLKALLANRLILDTVGHNIANANTPGFSRQRVELSSSHALQLGGRLLGSGVDANSVGRSVDNLLHRRILQQLATGGSLRTRVDGLSSMENLFQEPGDASMGAALDGFFAGVSALSATPNDTILRTGMVQSALTLTSQLKDAVSQLSNLRSDFGGELDSRVDEVNSLAERMAQLNVAIGKAESGGQQANDLRDARDQTLKQLSDLVELRSIEDPSGVVRVLISGSALVGASEAHELSATRSPSGEVSVHLSGVQGKIDAEGGIIGGLIELSDQSAPQLTGQLDKLARSLILEVNRLHSTGTPVSGGFHQLTGQYALVDNDKDGKLEDELLSRAGLPFDVQSGDLYVNVRNEATGSIERSRVTISKTHTTVGQLLEQLNGIPHMNAELDSQGRVKLLSDSGFGFDFSRAIDPRPDAAGTFAGSKASLGTATAEPFALATGDTLELYSPASSASPVTITFDAADFQAIGSAKAEEIAALINADAGAQVAGMNATVVDGRLFLQSTSGGQSVDFAVDGSATAALGWSGLIGTSIAGSDLSSEVEIHGDYTGSDNGRFTFGASGDGTIGTTAGLTVDVFDQEGQKVATLDVGEGYDPGSQLEVADGLSVSFGLGEISATHNDAFAVDVTADGDTSDVLVALGVNSFFTGTGAADIDVRADIQLDPDLLASSATGDSGDNHVLLGILDVQESELDGLDKLSMGEFYGGMVGALGFDLSSTMSALDANETLVSTLEQRREQVSGVNLDEELADMLRFEQAYTAAAQYLTVMNQLHDDLINIL